MEKLKIFYTWLKNNWIVIFIIFIFFIIFAGIIGLIYLLYTNRTNSKLIEDLVKILLSWPTTGSFVLLIFITLFKESINIFLSNNRPKLPYTDERSQEPEPEKEAIKKESAIETDEDFKYLALFFVDATKRILLWFYLQKKGNGFITHESFNISWQPIVTDSGQRATILSVLQQNRMIQGIPGGALSITERGEDFLRYIGAIQ